MRHVVRTLRWLHAAPAVTLGALLVAGGACRGAGTVAGPSPASAAAGQPTVVALVVKGGVLLKASHLDGARQVEGILEWQPATLWYQSFDPGQWWFSTTDWEWTIVPSEGRALWGIWRNEGATGNGVLGLIRFEGEPSIESLHVWVDGRPVDAVMEGRGADRTRPDSLLPGSGRVGGRQGGTGGPLWFLDGLHGH